MTGPSVRIACVQMRPELGRPDINLAAMEAWVVQACEGGADIVLFPECALQGIVFNSKAEAREASDSRDGEQVSAAAALASRLGVCIVFGFLETLPGGVANATCTALPTGERHYYHKTHLTELGADRFVDQGDAMSGIVEFRGLRFGVIICYDIRFPEATRQLALAGADAVLLATNSPVGYEGTYDHAARTRAWENRIWMAVANRVGTEVDATFIGRSLVVDPFGAVVAQAGGEAEELLFADIDVSQARSKLLPGHDGAQYSFWSARRPDLYGPLLAEAVELDDASLEAAPAPTRTV
jgi:predicted amidohydrolase